MWDASCSWFRPSWSETEKCMDSGFWNHLVANAKYITYNRLTLLMLNGYFCIAQPPVITVEFSNSSHMLFNIISKTRDLLIQISFPLYVVNSTSGHRLEPVWLLTISSKSIFFSNPWFGFLLSNPFSCSLSQRAGSLRPSSCAYPNTHKASEIHSIRS